MTTDSDISNMAVFCDFENIAIGVRETTNVEFDIQKILERLLVRGNIIVKKAYCDWDRYRKFKPLMHEASFELIEIPHVKQSGKNSADIRMVVDALHLCYTNSHVDTFVIITGDSDFSPLVSKLRESSKTVIGIGARNSTSDLLMANCDGFIFYDDIAKEKKTRKRAASKKKNSGSGRGKKKKTSQADAKIEASKQEAIDLTLETLDALFSERGDEGKIWSSMVKQALRRRKPGFNESHYGFRSFSKLLEEAEARDLLVLTPDEKSGGYVVDSLVQEDI